MVHSERKRIPIVTRIQEKKKGIFVRGGRRLLSRPSSNLSTYHATSYSTLFHPDHTWPYSEINWTPMTKLDLTRPHLTPIQLPYPFLTPNRPTWAHLTALHLIEHIWIKGLCVDGHIDVRSDAPTSWVAVAAKNIPYK